MARARAGLSHHSRTSMQINVHRNSLPRVYSLSCGGGVFGSTEFYLHFCPLENASLVLAPGKRKCGISPGKGELGGCREGHGEKEPLEHKCAACGCFFSFQLTLFYILCVHFKQRENKSLHGCGKHLGIKKKANAQELESKSVYLEYIKSIYLEYNILNKSCSFP